MASHRYQLEFVVRFDRMATFLLAIAIMPTCSSCSVLLCRMITRRPSSVFATSAMSSATSSERRMLPQSQAKAAPDRAAPSGRPRRWQLCQASLRRLQLPKVRDIPHGDLDSLHQSAAAARPTCARSGSPRDAARDRRPSWRGLSGHERRDGFSGFRKRAAPSRRTMPKWVG
jgi:hypothetical protein